MIGSQLKQAISKISDDAEIVGIFVRQHKNQPVDGVITYTCKVVQMDGDSRMETSFKYNTKGNAQVKNKPFLKAFLGM